MKVAALALGLLLSPMVGVLAAQGMQGMEMKKDVPGSAYRARGVVKSVDAEKGTVSIAHGPVAALKWPSMTMSFHAQDRKLLENLEPGAKVEFEFVQRGSRYLITSIKKETS